MDRWVWPIRQENWPTVKKEKVWAVRGKKGKGSKVKKGDEIIFYLNQTMFFTGIYKVVSDWHKPTIIWPDETPATPADNEIDLEVVQLGFASVHKLLPDLKFIENKAPKLVGLALRAMPQGPANSGKPIPEDDYNIIRKELKNEQKEPDFKKSQDDQYWLRKQQDLGSLSEFSDKVERVQLEVLNEISQLKGKTRSGQQLGWSSKGDGRLKSKRVSEPYLIHPLGRGTFTPADSKYAQSIFLSPRTIWDLEIVREHPTLKINYDYGDSTGTNYQTDIKNMTACKEIGLPIGVFFKLKKNRYRCLGLGRIISNDKNNFTIVSYGMTDEESTKIKNAVLEDYDAINKDQSVSKIPAVNYEEITRSDLESDFPFNELIRTVQTDRQAYKISQIIDKCQAGELVVPDFQRFFIWKKEMVRKFFDSIFNGYYIGPFLFWESRDKDIGVSPINGVDIKNPSANQIIIDGQQRISSIYYALRSPPGEYLKGEKEPTFFYIDFGKFFKKSADQNDIIQIFNKELDYEDQFKKLLFPLNQLEKYDRWLTNWNNFMGNEHPELDHHKDVRQLEDKLRTKLRFILTEFPCPHIALQNIDLDAVISIFERINTTGEKLNAFDLLIAKLSKYGIKLRDLWEDTCKNYPRVKEYLEKSKKTTQGLPILHSMSLCFTDSGSCRRSDVLKIFERMNLTDSEEFETKWNEMVKFTDEAIQLLEKTGDGFGVLDSSYLPSESMIPVLAAFLRMVDKEFGTLEKTCNEKIGCWYWSSALTNAYSGSSDSQKTLDYKEIIKWFKHDDEIPESIVYLRNNFFRSIRLGTAEKKSASNFNAVLGLCALRGARDWYSNSEVRNQTDYAKKYTLDIDHIFPKSKYQKESYNESILNKTLLRKRTNISKSDQEISKLLVKTLKENFQNNKKEFLKTLQGHFINSTAFDHLLEDDHEKFVQEREHEILKEIGKRIGSTIKDFTPPLKSNVIDEYSESTIEELLQEDESDVLEFKATLKFDKRQKKANPEMVKEVITTIAGFMNSKKGGTLVVGYDERLNEINGIEEDLPHVGKTHDYDAWRNTLMSSFEEHCGKNFAQNISNITTEKNNGKTLVKIIVRYSTEKEVYYDKEFYRRTHGRTTKLEGREMTNYIKEIWQ